MDEEDSEGTGSLVVVHQDDQALPTTLTFTPLPKDPDR